MIKKTIKFNDYDGNPDQVDAYFHLTRKEIIEIEIEEVVGLEAVLKEIQATNDRKRAYNLIKKVVVTAYGERSPDGKKFSKSEQMRVEFEQGLAFDQLLFDMLSKPEEAAAFIASLVPANPKADADSPTVPHAPRHLSVEGS